MTLTGSVALLLAGCVGCVGEARVNPASIEEAVARTTVSAAVEPAATPLMATETGSEGWRLHRPNNGDAHIEAFTSESSGVPGTRIGLMVSTREHDYRVVAYRIGDYDGGSGHRVWTSTTHRGRIQGKPRFSSYETRTIIAPWSRDLTVDTTGWRPGLYVFKLRTGNRWEAQVPYVVSSPSANGTIALVAPVTTWQAYNRWGGYSLYWSGFDDRRSWAVSFDRPYHPVRGANDFRQTMVPVVILAEQQGLPLSYFTNVDLHAHADALLGALGYVSIGHDEYWTPRMRETVLKLRGHGTNLAFLGANTMYWRIRLADHHRTVIGYRDDAWRDPVRETRPWATTARFRDLPVPRPENDTLGMLYECYPVSTAYQVTTPRWWGFAGTGVERGTSFAALVGPESDRVYPNTRTPRPLQVLSNSPYSCRGVMTSGQSIYYTAPSGAGVFSAGTLRWGCAVADACEVELGRGAARFVRTVTVNLLRGFAQGPVGPTHPAHDNVDQFDLPLVNGVSAS